MDEEKIEQKVEVTGRARVRNIIQVGKIVIRHPSVWQKAVWGFLSKNRGFIVVAIVLEAALAVVYLHFRDLYLIPLWRWNLAAMLLTAATWGWYTWGWYERTRIKLVLTSLATLCLVGVVSWQTGQIAFPERFAPRVFGIAVAELGEGPDFQRTAKAREISGQVYEHLYDAIRKEFPDESSDTRRVGPRRIGVIPDSQTAQAYGERIWADVVIWGQVLTSKERGVTIRFQVIETPDRAVNPEFPLVLPVTTKSADMYVSEFDLESDQAKEVIVQQSTIIASFTLGLRAYFDRNYPEAVRQFEFAAQAMEENPLLTISEQGKSLLYFYLGRANHGMGRIEQGQYWLGLAQKGNSKEPAVHIGLALGYGSLGQDQERDANLRLALDLGNIWLETHPYDTAGMYDRGIIYEILGQYQNAIYDFEAVIERDPNYYVAYISLGVNASKLGRFKQAEDSLRAAIALAERTGTNSSWAHLNLALVYDKFDKPDLAKAEYQKAVALAPEVDSMYYSYARFLENQQETDAALLAYQKMAEVTRNKGWGYGNLADFLKRRGLLEQARDNYELAVHARPEDALLHAYLAETYFELGEVDNALREFEEAIKHSEDLYYVYASYAGALFQLGNFEHAAQMYERSLELRPIDYPVLLNLGQTYENLDQREKAKDLYFRILSWSDHFPEEATHTACKRLRALGVENPCR